MDANRFFSTGVAVLGLVVIAITPALSQHASRTTREIASVGIQGGYGLEGLASSFAVGGAGELTSSISCGRFEEGSAQRWTIGLHASRPVSSTFRAGIDIELSGRNGDLSFPCVDPAQVRLPDGSLVDALTEHVAAISTTSLRFLPALSLYPAVSGARPFISAGPALGLTLAGKYEVHEEITSPATAEFLSGGQVRHYGGGDFSTLSARVPIGVHVGLGVDLPAGRSLELTPTLRGVLWFGNDVEELGLKGAELGLSLRLSYRIDRRRNPVVVSSDGRGPGNALVSLRAGAVRTGTSQLSDTLHGIRVRRLSTRLHPLLTYIFFNKGDSAIPPRYTHQPTRAVGDFSEQDLEGESTLAVYHSLLDIIGSRLRRHPDAPLRIVASGPDARTDAEGLDLARKRGMGIRSYLADVWRIDTSRLTLETRRSPSAVSSEETEDGAAENRRVELLSSDLSITAPIVFVDTINTVEWEHLAADVVIEAPSELSSWSLTAGENVIAQGEDVASVRQRFDRPGREVVTQDVGTLPVVVRYETDGGDEGTASTYVPVSVTSVDSGRSLGTGSYSLILFDFRSSDLRTEHVRTLDLINDGTDPRASARIEGYTDRLGSDDLNLKLSADRARSVAKGLRMRVDEIVGRGESIDLYDNDLPEGRFYSRSVTIVTRLPE